LFHNNKKMDIIFNDPRNWISKTQRDKIRDYCKHSACPLAKDILRLIEYRDGEGAYFSCDIKEDTDSLNTILTFDDRDPEVERRKELRARLAHRINSSRGSRSKHVLDSDKRYYELSSNPQLRRLNIPKPVDVVRNKEQYEAVLTMDQMSWFKDYINLCFTDEKALLRPAGSK